MSKPLLMPVLILFVLASIDYKNIYVKLLLLALCASWAGDVLLMFTGDHYFLVGLASFLVAHVVYSYLFLKAVRVFSKPNNPVRFISTIVMSVFLMTSIKLLAPFTSALRIPVVIYSTVISFMCVAAWWRYKRSISSSYWMVLSGAILFVVSDSFLGFNRFIQSFPTSGFAIMSTYLLAQFLIAKGITRHLMKI